MIFPFKHHRFFVMPIILSTAILVCYFVSFEVSNIYILGIYPMQISSIVHIFSAPFIHKDINHALSNVIPLFIILSCINYFFYKIKNTIVLFSIILPGIFVWIIGRPSFHIGASGVVYALLFFVIFYSILSRQQKYLILTAIILLMNGGIVWGLLPIVETTSWESHVGGAITGIMLAFYFRKRRNLEWIENKTPYSPISTTFHGVEYHIVLKSQES